MLRSYGEADLALLRNLSKGELLPLAGELFRCAKLLPLHSRGPGLKGLLSAVDSGVVDRLLSYGVSCLYSLDWLLKG